MANIKTNDACSVEEWRDVLDYEGFYQVSNLGRVRSLDRIESFPHPINGILTRKFKGKILDNVGIDRDGYRKVTLSKLGINKKRPIYRLVAEAFVYNPNPKIKQTVNHIDGVKTHDFSWNLEWVTRSENMRHAFDTGLIKDRGNKPVLLIDKDKNIVKRFETKYEAIRGNWRKEFPKPYGSGTVYKCFHENIPFHGLIFVYEEDFKNE